MEKDFYNPKEIEKDYYEYCKNQGYFEVDSNKKIQKENKNFAIMMPPPNVTGVLHIGHALTFTLQDVITRYKRMDGYKVLYQPGLDHAGIATQNVVEKQLLAQGIKKEELGREEFIKKVWEWKEKSGGAIVNQMYSLGITPAFSRMRFTMDEGLQYAVKKAFVDLYDKGLITKDNRMINWCTKDGALSDIEVEYEENKSKLYYLRYYLKDSKEYLVVATTRPETYFGDSALMVNPEDERYKNYIGKSVLLPILNKEIKIIADSYVDSSFGSGVVKVTPAHDINDYEVGLRHNLDFITIFDEKGILNDKCAEFAGLERLQARQIIIEKLQELGYVEKIQDYVNQVGKCYRCKNIVEPYISKQWFVSTKIADSVITKVNNNECKFYPAHWINSFNAWMKDLRPWCISRQLWWGHQIPVYYCECGNCIASVEEVSQCPKCLSKNIKQDEDVLDTWFSSGLWAFSTLGLNNNDYKKGILYQESDIKDFYPNSLLITGFDILFFWVCRMLFQSDNELNELPFKDIYLHALVKDENGDKMSKSKGNVIDPLVMIDTYSADILRFTLCLLAVQGRDIRMSEERMILVRNFTNKLYNAANFLLLKDKNYKELSEFKTKLGLYMNAKFNLCVNEVRQYLAEYRFNDASMSIYKFLWDEFCDIGIEHCKFDTNSLKEIASVFLSAMRLLNPFMPFISEYLFHKLQGSDIKKDGSIMIEQYPLQKDLSPSQKEHILEYEKVIEAINVFRSIKKSANITDKNAQALINIDLDIDYLKLICFIVKLKEIKIAQEFPSEYASLISNNLKAGIKIDENAKNALKEKLSNQAKKLENEINKLQNMLNPNFIAKAPKNLVEQNQNALNEAKNKLEEINKELSSLN